MKTKELIKQLQQADPTGDMDCCIGNRDIHFVATAPAYWDGCKQVLIRDEDCEYYNIIGAKISSEGQKLVIHELSIESILWDNPDLPIEYDEYSERHYKKEHTDLAQEVKDYISEMEKE